MRKRSQNKSELVHKKDIKEYAAYEIINETLYRISTYYSKRDFLQKKNSGAL